MLPPGRPGRRSILWRPRKQDLDPLRDDVPQVRGLHARAAVVPHGYDILHEARHYDPLAAVPPCGTRPEQLERLVGVLLGRVRVEARGVDLAPLLAVEPLLVPAGLPVPWQDRSQWIVVPCLVKDVIAVGY